MISLEFSGRASEDIRQRAGYTAEQTLAHYLNRAFADEAYIHVFHGLRVERQGEFAQMDHLVMHRFGFTLVESKSISGKVHINEHGEFVKTYERKKEGMDSPIAQARRQAELLMNLLNDHKVKLRGMVGLGPLKQQGSFGDHRFQVIAAMSEKCIIEWAGKRPAELMKADAVVDAIKQKIADHQSMMGVGGFINFMTSGYMDKKKARENDKNNVYPFTDEEFKKISAFLLASNRPGRQSTNQQVVMGATAERSVKADAVASNPAAVPRAASTAARQPQRQASAVPSLESAKEVDAAGQQPVSNNMKRWGKDELSRLRQAFEAGKRPEDIAADFGRTAKALRMRAEQIGLIDDVSKW